MPELPEVETIRRELQQVISNKVITEVWANAPRMLNLSANKLKAALQGQKVLAVERRGKLLIWRLSGGQFLLTHLKMTGQLVYRNKAGRTISGGHPINPQLAVKLELKGDKPVAVSNLPNKFTHLIFTFKDGSRIFFNDIRKFGYAHLVSQAQLTKILAEKYGIEPLQPNFTLANFTKVLANYPKAKIKQLLLDQVKISGIGNIYADESCWCAKILPSRPVGKIKPAEIKKLYQCINKILKLAISKGGTSADTYVKLDGQPGGFVPYLKVYGRGKEKCKNCGRPITKIFQNGRGTHFCQNCQK
ncbi:MAG: bifunctional DNA-formamidopyrimidine glycosylase/DNA-(apurinic or apyrimidinic site) lyase [Candidatus Buchananbacteria bacterium]